MRTLSPRISRRAPSAPAVSPLPKEETTPPVTKIYFIAYGQKPPSNHTQEKGGRRGFPAAETAQNSLPHPRPRPSSGRAVETLPPGLDHLRRRPHRPRVGQAHHPRRVLQHQGPLLPRHAPLHGVVPDADRRPARHTQDQDVHGPRPHQPRRAPPPRVRVPESPAPHQPDQRAPQPPLRAARRLLHRHRGRRRPDPRDQPDRQLTEEIAETRRSGNAEIPALSVSPRF